jgi:hypothetical protein
MFYVKVNNYKVKLYNLTTHQYNKYKDNIMKILEDDNIFCSITRNITDKSYISLFVQQCELTKILDNDYDIVKDLNFYNIFSIYELENGINQFGIVSNISNSFCKYNISIIYINTFSENLIFVNENDYEKALECLITLVNADNIYL